jgi:arginase family enzyme
LPCSASPIEIGASQRGTLMGPAALRTAGLVTLLHGLGFDVKDHGDLRVDAVSRTSTTRRPTMPGITGKFSAGSGP